ncbi:MAG: hypothetical protein GX066_02200 [Clostridiaceae bacterium]|nr:hypothetical protein [Clostridiaceae bacterium]
MLLFRRGPRILFLRSRYIDDITDFLITTFNGEIFEFMDGMKRATENSTICFITGIGLDKPRVKDAKKIVLINDDAFVILSSIINNHVCNLFNKVDIGPATIVMRVPVPGNEQKLIDKIKEVFNAKEVDLIEGIDIGGKDDTIIAFTYKVLSGPVTDFLDTKLLIPQPGRLVRGKLRLEGLRFITQSLDDSQWYELRINIYDSTGRYKENYDRLMFVLSKLEIGMILGESWTKDYAVMLYSVLTYQVRLFTFSKPEDIKKILMALEYSADGTRLVDFDLYYKNRKIHWSEVNKVKSKKSKIEEVVEYRKKLYEMLNEEDIKTLEDMEKHLLLKKA